MQQPYPFMRNIFYLLYLLSGGGLLDTFEETSVAQMFGRMIDVGAEGFKESSIFDAVFPSGEGAPPPGVRNK